MYINNILSKYNLNNEYKFRTIYILYTYKRKIMSIFFSGKIYAIVVLFYLFMDFLLYIDFCGPIIH